MKCSKNDKLPSVFDLSHNLELKTLYFDSLSFTFDLA